MSADAVPNAAEQIPDAEHPAGVGLIKPGYDPKLTNEDLAPLHKQNWSTYAVITVVVTGVIAILLSLFTGVGDFGWFIGCGLGFAIFALLERTRPMITVPPADEENVSDGTVSSVA